MSYTGTHSQARNNDLQSGGVGVDGWMDGWMDGWIGLTTNETRASTDKTGGNILHAAAAAKPTTKDQTNTVRARASENNASKNNNDNNNRNRHNNYNHANSNKD